MNCGGVEVFVLPAVPKERQLDETPDRRLIPQPTINLWQLSLARQTLHAETPGGELDQQNGGEARHQSRSRPRTRDAIKEDVHTARRKVHQGQGDESVEPGPYPHSRKSRN